MLDIFMYDPDFYPISLAIQDSSYLQAEGKNLIRWLLRNQAVYSGLTHFAFLSYSQMDFFPPFFFVLKLLSAF